MGSHVSSSPSASSASSSRITMKKIAAAAPDPREEAAEQELALDFELDGFGRGRGARHVVAEDRVPRADAPQMVARRVADAADEVRPDVMHLAGVREVGGEHVVDERLGFGYGDAELLYGDLLQELRELQVSLLERRGRTGLPRQHRRRVLHLAGFLLHPTLL